MGRSFQWMMAGMLVVLATSAGADWEMNMTKGVTDISQTVYSLHMIIFGICVVIGVVVFGVMIYSMIAHRKSQGAVAANFHESTWVEVLWTLIPFAILVGMAIPATGALKQIYSKGDPDLTVEIVGYQWKWRYRYLSDDPSTEISFFSNLTTPPEEISNEAPKNTNYLLEVDEPMVLPVNKRVRFVITAADVIHAWWVPELAVKKDAVPGIINEAWTKVNVPGIYRGQCAELCGKDHGFMPIVVDVREQDEFDSWLVAKQDEAKKLAELTSKDWTMAELMERGEQVYGTFCSACHQADGSGVPPAFPPLKASPIALGEINKHIEVVVKGVNGTSMQAFGSQLSEVDMAAVITYERNAWGNNTGDLVSPMDIVNYNAEQ